MSTGAINLDNQGYTAYRAVGGNTFDAGRSVQIKDRSGRWSVPLEIKHIANLGNGLYSMRMKGKDGREWTLTISMQRQSQTSQSDSNRVQRRPEYDNRVAQWIYDHTRGLESLGNYAQSHPGEALAVGLGGGLLIAAAPIIATTTSVGSATIGVFRNLTSVVKNVPSMVKNLTSIAKNIPSKAQWLRNFILEKYGITSLNYANNAVSWRNWTLLGFSLYGALEATLNPKYSNNISNSVSDMFSNGINLNNSLAAGENTAYMFCGLVLPAYSPTTSLGGLMTMFPAIFSIGEIEDFQPNQENQRQQDLAMNN